jgi:hypothetical protein
LLVVAHVAFWAILKFASEDAYITFRYARSLTRGLGLVYNEGERVMGFSSPLWTLWSALGIALVRDPVSWTRATSTLADVFTLLLMAHMLRRHLSRAAGWCFAFFFAVWGPFAAVAISGMENNVMIMLIALAAALSERGSAAAGPALGALALIRPEGLAAAAVVALGARWRERAVGLAIAVAGYAALAAYFGTWIPQSVAAKASIYGTPGPWAGRHWWEWVVPFALGRWPITTEGGYLYLLSPVMAPAMVLGARRLWGIRRTAPALAAAAGLVVWLGYSVLGVAYFYWYLVVPLAGVAVLAAAGLPEMTRGRALYVGLALFALGSWTIVPKLYRARLANEVLGFGQTADLLARNAQAGQSVMLEPIGMVGWRCRLRVIDEVGLVSPQVARRRTQGPGWMTDVVRQEKPDWLVLRRVVLRDSRAFAGTGAPFRSAEERDLLMASYARDTTVYEAAGENALEIYRRR